MLAHGEGKILALTDVVSYHNNASNVSVQLMPDVELQRVVMFVCVLLDNAKTVAYPVYMFAKDSSIQGMAYVLTSIAKKINDRMSSPSAHKLEPFFLIVDIQTLAEEALAEICAMPANERADDQKADRFTDPEIYPHAKT